MGQDWMTTEYDRVTALQANISMGDLWLSGMNSGVASSGRTMQYCMPYPYDVLSASALGAVTNARASTDYSPGPSSEQWAIGGTALFYWALNILPFKDGFYSSTNVQVGGQSKGPSRTPDRETLIATLSGAMVAPMDGIHLLNASRVMTTCRLDGTVLKPDRPLTTVDSCFRKRNPTCSVYQTSSDHVGYGTVQYYFNNHGHDQMLAEEVYVNREDASKHVVYNWFTGDLAMLKVSNSMAAGYEGFVYATVMPVVEGWIFAGEIDKYVTAADVRFENITVSSAVFSVDVLGVAKEKVKVCVAKVSQLQLVCQTASFESQGMKTVTF